MPGEEVAVKPLREAALGFGNEERREDSELVFFVFSTLKAAGKALDDAADVRGVS